MENTNKTLKQLIDEVAKTKNMKSERIEAAFKSFENADREVFNALLDIFYNKEVELCNKEYTQSYFSKRIEAIKSILAI